MIRFLVQAANLLLLTTIAAESNQQQTAAVPLLRQESLSGTIALTQSADRPMVFISIDVDSDGLADRGFLVELDTQSVRTADLKRRGTVDWRYQKSLILTFEDDSRDRVRIVLQSRSSSNTFSPPLSQRDKSLAILAMHRFKFIKPMSHADLAPLQLKRNLSSQHRLPN